MNLNSRILGSSEKKLVILHGFLGSLDNWITIGRKLEQLNLEVHLVDLRNHGKSFHSKDFSYDYMCFDLKKYLDSKNIKKTSILGHSMGGKVVFSFLENHENYLDKIIIADILPVEYKNSYDNIFQSLKSINPRTLTKRIEFEEHLKNYFDDELFISFLSKNLTRDENGNFKFKFNLITLSEKFDEVLKALKPSRIIDKEINLILEKINNEQSKLRALAERGVLKILEGDCETAVGVHSEIVEDKITLEAELFSLDGSQRFYEKSSDVIQNAENLGFNLGKILKTKSKNSYKK